MPDIAALLGARPWILYAVVLLPFGAATGSFLNVVICRLPWGLSLLSPPSSCPGCGRRIAARDNVPVLGWLLLRGRCRGCGARIPARYPGVEALTAVLWAAVGAFHAAEAAGADWGAATSAGLLAAKLLFVSALVAAAFIDFDHQILPDEITLGGTVAALVASGLLPALHPETADAFPRSPAFLNGLFGGLLGALVGSGFLFVLMLIGTAVFRRQIRRAQETDPDITTAMGLGDVKLLAFTGAFLGWAGVLASFFVGTLVGAVAGIWDKLRTGAWPEPGTPAAAEGGLAALGHRWRTGESVMPYGPFLAIGAVAVVLFREPLLAWLGSAFLGPFLDPPA
jgi:leader peptidase (prepilin peptidase)/N-methyltransferase